MFSFIHSYFVIVKITIQLFLIKIFIFDDDMGQKYRL
jgi:hypothetical protein